MEERGIKVTQIKIPRKMMFDPLDILNILSEENITSVFIEGGKELFSQFISRNLYDEIIILQSSTFFGKGLPAIEMDNTLELDLQSVEKLGKDVKLQLAKKTKDFSVLKEYSNS